VVVRFESIEGKVLQPGIQTSNAHGKIINEFTKYRINLISILVNEESNWQHPHVRTDVPGHAVL
jgi:hypothetical protein